MENNIVKATSALYRLLEMFPEVDPLKRKCKEMALVIVEQATRIFPLNGRISFDRQEEVRQLLENVAVLENYLKIGKDQGWMSAVNFLIITKEYELLRQTIAPLLGVRVEPSNVVAIAAVKAIVPPRPEKAVVRPEKVVARKEKKDSADLEAYSDRQKTILAMLNKRTTMQVADILKEIPNITKRTLRRDLDDLLKKGKVVRKGEWNKVAYGKA